MLFEHSVKRRSGLSVQLALGALAAVGCGNADAGNTTMQGVATAPAMVAGAGVSASMPAAGMMASASSAAGSPAAAAASGKAGAAAPSSAASAGASGMTMPMTPMTMAGPKANPDGTVVRGTGPATFTRVWEEILMPKGCAGAYCHGSGVGGLKFMKKEEAYSVLVGVMAGGPACGTSGKMRVKAGDPAASLLLEKMSAEKPSCGDAMPIGSKLEPNCVSMNTSVCNTMEDLKLVREWIMSGAKND